MPQKPLSIVILISGKGSNLQAIIDAIKTGLSVNILSVISNKPDAMGLARAKRAEIPTKIISHRDYLTKDDFEAALMQAIDHYAPELIVLAGFMRTLSAKFVRHYQRHIINIHPSLLPKYKGLHTHRSALAAGDSEHGVSVHYVTEAVDSGPIICQAKLTVLPNDTEESLQARVHQIEHKVYPEVLSWMATGRIELRDNTVFFDGKALPKSGKLFETK